jgi:hypothetical protein
MAKLDYAFLTEYAKISDGLLTTVGASYTFARIPGLPSPFVINVAGRVRMSDGDRPQLGISIEGPNDRFRIDVTNEMSTEGARPYGPQRTVGVLFVASAPLILTEYGLYTINIELDGDHARTLRFEVEAAP